MYGQVLENNSKNLFLKEQVRVLYDGCRSSVVGTILIAAVIYLTDIPEIGGNSDAEKWVFLIWLIAILREVDAFLFSRADKKKLDYGLFLVRFATGSTLAAISWALLFWNIFPASSPEYQALIILILTGIPSFAATTLSYHLGVIIPFLVLVMLPIEIKVLMQNSNFYTALSFLIPLYFLFQVNSAKRINKKYLENIRLQLEYQEKEKENKNLQYAIDQHGIVSVTDIQGNIIYANEKLVKISKYSQEELIGKNHRVLKSDEHSLAFWKDMWHKISSGKVWHSEVKNIAKDGTPYWVDSTVVPCMDEKGKPYQYISIRTEITKLKELEQQNINDKNDALIRAQVAQILQGQSSLNQRMAEALDAMSKAEGLQIQNKLGVFQLPENACELEMFVTHGHYTDEFLHREQCVKLGDCLCGRAAVSGELIISDDCLTDPDHEHKFIGMTSHGHYIVPLSHNGKVLGILFIYTDPYPSRDQSRLDTLNLIGDLLGVAIANERVKEELQLARKHAEDMAQTKSDFLANMSHEIRTPMNGVLGMLELLDNMPLDDKSKGYVEIAHGSANMLLNVINDILDISKIESGKLHIEHIDFDLRKTVEDVADLLFKLAYQKTLELIVFIPPEIRNILQGDVMRLQQVLSNLISNAIKFTHEGEVTINISTVEESANRTRLRFEIKDTGIGISTEKQDSLFQAFTQADTSTSRKYGGTGLGLAISKSLIEMMGGEIGLISTVGDGSTFWFELPFDIVSREYEHPLSMDGLRILTIDDNEASCLVQKKYVESWGVDHVAETIPEIGLYRLKEAIEQGRPFDILLLDMKMPSVTGQEVADEIRKDPAFSELKIILLSSMSLYLGMDTQQYFDLMLNKPIRQSLLYDAIAAIENQDLLPKKNTHTIKPEVEKLTGKILFVDDNLVNQHVGGGMLTKLGVDFEITSNGQEALDARKRGIFDLILMDCQMPVMDGFEATRQIRQYERESGTDRMTIVALTANAMQGDRKKCLDSGMNDYLTKPYTQKSLFKTLSRWLPKISPANEIDLVTVILENEPGAIVKDTEPQTNIINSIKFEETREIMGENMDLILDAFIESGTTQVAEMKDYLETGNFEGLRSTVHALKGNCGALGVQKLFQLCKDTETNCRLGKTRDMHKRVEAISLLFNESLTAIQILMREQEV